MQSNRPYLIRAFYQWIVDNACTPILVLDALNPRCKVPKDYIDGDEIVFNISGAAVRDLKIANDQIEFTASFSGVIHFISAPIRAVLSVYAEENGEGIFLDAEDDDSVSSEIAQMRPTKTVADSSFDEQKIVVKGKPALTIVE